MSSTARVLKVCWTGVELLGVCHSPGAATSWNLWVQNHLNYSGLWNKAYMEVFWWTQVWSREVFNHMLKFSWHLSPISFKEARAWMPAAFFSLQLPPGHRFKAHYGRKKKKSACGRHLLTENAFVTDYISLQYFDYFYNSNKPKLFLKFQVIHQHTGTSLTSQILSFI